MAREKGAPADAQIGEGALVGDVRFHGNHIVGVLQRRGLGCGGLVKQGNRGYPLTLLFL